MSILDRYVFDRYADTDMYLTAKPIFTSRSKWQQLLYKQLYIGYKDHDVSIEPSEKGDKM